MNIIIVLIRDVATYSDNHKQIKWKVDSVNLSHVIIKHMTFHEIPYMVKGIQL